LLLERGGLATTLTLPFKGDVKRETRFVAQYGQMVCTFFTALLIWQLDAQRGLRICLALWSGVIGVTIVGTIAKRLLGRARPRRENAGKFLGPSLKHANFRESFPSTHSASAVALCVGSGDGLSARGDYVLDIGDTLFGIAVCHGCALA